MSHLAILESPTFPWNVCFRARAILFHPVRERKGGSAARPVFPPRSTVPPHSARSSRWAISVALPRSPPSQNSPGSLNAVRSARPPALLRSPVPMFSSPGGIPVQLAVLPRSPVPMPAPPYRGGWGSESTRKYAKALKVHPSWGGGSPPEHPGKSVCTRPWTIRCAQRSGNLDGARCREPRESDT